MALVLIKAVFRVDPWNKMVTLLIVITDLNRFCGECLWDINSYQNMCALIDGWIVLTL